LPLSFRSNTLRDSHHAKRVFVEGHKACILELSDCT
jgi:hypothetical protein